MATSSQAVTAVPTALAGTVADTRYAVQNKGASAVTIAVAAGRPAADSDATFAIPPGAFGYPQPAVGESIWVWGAPGAKVAYEATG